MDRQEIYELIEDERVRQDEKWRVGRVNEAQYKFAAPHILLLEEQALKLRQSWYVSTSEDFKNRLVITAAVAIRALEEIE